MIEYKPNKIPLPKIPKKFLEKNHLVGRKAVFVGDPQVWASAASVETLEQNPYYIFFDRGTNDFYILRYRDETIGWEYIGLSEIPLDHLYGLLWKWSTQSKRFDIELWDAVADVASSLYPHDNICENLIKKCCKLIGIRVKNKIKGKS